MGAFPQARKVSLVEQGTHAEIAMVIKRLACGETTAMQALWRHIPAGSLLLEDRGFFSYSLWKRALAEHVQLLARVKSNLIPEPIRHLSDGSYLAKIYRNFYDRSKDRNGIVVRVIRYKRDDPQRVGHHEEHVLMTTLLDESEHSALELICLSHERWEEELTYDEQKTHQDPRRATKPAQLRSQTPAGVIQELYALSLAHFVIRALMFEAAESVHLDPERLSFTGCFQILKCRLPECVTHNTGNVSDMVRQPALGDAAGASPTASQSHQPASHQTEDQEVAKEAAPPSTSTKTQQNIRRISPYSLIPRYCG